jgi:hypothetical protein
MLVSMRDAGEFSEPAFTARLAEVMVREFTPRQPTEPPPLPYKAKKKSLNRQS